MVKSTENLQNIYENAVLVINVLLLTSFNMTIN